MNIPLKTLIFALIVSLFLWWLIIACIREVWLALFS